MSSVRYVKIILMLIPAVQGLLIGLINVSDYPGVVAEVTRTLTMEATWKLPQHMWRATDNPLMIHATCFFIIGMELALGVLCTLGAVRMWRARSLDKASFNQAKRLGLWGGMCGIVLFYGGFMIGAGQWYFIWQGLAAPVLNAAFRDLVAISLVMLIVAETNHD